MNSKHLSVTELNIYLKNIVDSEDLIHGICVVGEVSGLSLRGPHAYFTLKDENSQLRCCCFSYKKTHVPKDGDLVLLYGSIDYYLKGGYISFNVIKIEPYGQGLLAVKLEELKKKLLAGGYFDESHKKTIPAFCQKIAVITSKDGAVLHDIVRTVRAKNELTDIDFFDVKVQGNNSAATIIHALKRVDTMDYDAIIIARGGGSFEDLMAFNDESLVYAIFDAVTPIISAVGHETDTTLCDYVADLRVPTPTAAGELFAYDINGYISDIKYKMNVAFQNIADKYKLSFVEYRELLQGLTHGTSTKYNEKYSDIKLINNNMINGINSKFSLLENNILASIKVLKACNPANILERGYAEVKREDGSLVTDITTLNVDDIVNLRGAKGEAVAKIMEVKED